MKLRIYIFLLVLIPGIQLFARDSLLTLSEKQVKELVKKFHPVARQADINIGMAKADITIAKALFDPLFNTRIANKTFDGVEYYNYVTPELSIPTWFGIELKAGYENVGGNNIDPQETPGKTSFAGISIPLVKNLVMDKRRATLQQSKIFRQLSEVERTRVVNDILLEAMDAYWNWVQQFQIIQVIKNTVDVNEKRFELVRMAFRQGDRPAIDTVEALAQLQSFRYAQQEAELNFLNAGLELSVFLWKETGEPYTLPASVIPDNSWRIISIPELILPPMEELMLIVRNRHPELQQFDFKLDALAVERKLKFQELLPTVNLQYNQLGKGYDLVETVKAPWFENNYQYGVSIGIPLRLSKGRGEYKKAKLKIAETEINRVQKLLELETKVKAYYNELVTLKKQVANLQQQYNNYQSLQKGEETRFLNGESSLFLVNSRENKTLEVLQKLATLESKFFKTTNSLQWAAGILINQ
ncbi:MAG TPA: TolC family protein [Chitinophagaceae bacterium]